MAAMAALVPLALPVLPALLVPAGLLVPQVLAKPDPPGPPDLAVALQVLLVLPDPLGLREVLPAPLVLPGL